MVRAFKFVSASLAGLVLLCAVVTGIGDVLISRANPPAGRFVDTASGRQHVLDVGPDSGAAAGAAAIVLVHGAAANLEDMRTALVGRLRTRHRVVAIDRPGHGWSERAGAADASPLRQAAVLHEILGNLDVERPVLVGHSWGGALAAAYALAYPENLRGLLLLAPATHPWTFTLPWYLDLITMPALGPLYAHTVALPLAYLALDRIVAHVFAPQRAPPGYAARASALLALRPSTMTANGEDLEGLRAFVTVKNGDYGRISTPTVIVTGSADAVLSPRVHARAMAQQVPGARLVVLPGIGHMPHHVRPERVVEAIERLIRTTEPAETPAESTPLQ